MKKKEPLCYCDICTILRTQRSAFFPPYITQPDFLICRSSKRAYKPEDDTNNGVWILVDYSLALQSRSQNKIFGTRSSKNQKIIPIESGKPAGSRFKQLKVAASS